MALIIAIPPNKMQDGRKNKYNLILISHRKRFQPGSRTNMPFVNPTSLFRPGMIFEKEMKAKLQEQTSK